MPKDNAIKALTLLGLEKCLQRLGRSSAGNWRVTEVEVYPGAAADALATYEGLQTAAVYMVMPLPLTGAMLAAPADLECISKAFTGHSFPRGGRVSAAEEVMLIELGNILINVLVNTLLNALKTTMLPALPAFMLGDAEALRRVLGQADGPARVIEARLSLECGGPAAEIHLFALLPERLAATLD